MTAPIGQRESESVELNGRDALTSGVKIVRAVVAFLNGAGGTVWVGVDERNGRAESATPIEDIDVAFERLQNQLIDTIEPAIRDEVVLERVPCPGRADGEILRLDVKRGDRGPYAQLEQKGRQYWVRVGSRNRVMTHGELGERFRRSANPSDDDATALSDRREAEAAGAQFWMSVRPRPPLVVDVSSSEMQALLTDASQTGNRPTGFTYVMSLGVPTTGGNAVTAGTDDYQRVRLFRDGRIELRATFERLNWGGAPEEISPFVLIELPLSVLRLARRVLELSAGDGEIVVDLALFGARGRTLRRGSPSEFSRQEPPAVFAYDSLVLDRPLAFRARDLLDSPERCNLRLVERVYEEFGLRRQDLPRELDPRTGAFLLGV